jgi:hypothetical protein
MSDLEVRQALRVIERSNPEVLKQAIKDHLAKNPRFYRITYKSGISNLETIPEDHKFYLEYPQDASPLTLRSRHHCVAEPVALLEECLGHPAQLFDTETARFPFGYAYESYSLIRGWNNEEVSWFPTLLSLTLASTRAPFPTLVNALPVHGSCQLRGTKCWTSVSTKKT